MSWKVSQVFAIAAAFSQPTAADDRQACLKASKETAAAAISACTHAIQSGEYKGRDLSDLYYHRGYTWSWTGSADRVDRAFRDYTEAIRLDPKAVGSLLNRSHIYNQRRDYDRAIADVNQAFEGSLSDYGKRVGYDERGQAYSFMHDYDRAIAEFDQAIRLEPKRAITLLRRGYAYQAKGDLDRAIADYDQMIALDPKDRDAYFNRGNAYRTKGDLDRAIADYDQLVALNPKNRNAYFNRGYVYRIKGDLDRAIADYDQMIALDPKDRDAYDNRAYVYRTKGDLDRAIADYAQMVALDPKDRNASFNLAIALLAKGDLDRPLADYNPAIVWMIMPGLVVLVWLWVCLLLGVYARGRSKPTLFEIYQQDVVETRRRNIALERIALSVDKRLRARAGAG